MAYQVMENGVVRDATPGEVVEIEARTARLPSQEEYVAAVQNMLDVKARERNYDNILSACTYATDFNPKFKAEGQACVEWRSAVWAKCYDLLAGVRAGTLAQPTLPGLLSMLPMLVWPG